jgi:hypothetical protein
VGGVQRIARTTDPDLYDPDRHEVLSGLTAHGLRVAIAVASNPAIWIGEFSAPLLRVITEILIVLTWLGTPEGHPPGIYARYKDFGRGHLKLMKCTLRTSATQTTIWRPSSWRRSSS